ncbi:MAG: K(+)-transporting ATPase subunit C [Acidimicrobiia bacterium]
MRRQILPAVMMVLVMTVVTGLIYTFAFTGVAQVVFPSQADGSFVKVGGKVVGSELIGQAWVDKRGNPLRQYFQSRPSAATNTTDAGYDPSLSLGSNLGPTNPCFVADPKEPCLDDNGKKIAPVVAQRVRDYRKLNGLSADAKVPVDAVTASGSGLDPQISVANARLQAQRVADERGISRKQVLRLIDEHTDARPLGVLGEAGVNVLQLNLALDRLSHR